FEAVKPFVPSGDGRPQFGDAADRRVMRVTRPDCVGRGFGNMLGRILVRLAETEVVDGDAGGFHLPRLGTRGGRGRRLYGRGELGNGKHRCLTPLVLVAIAAPTVGGLS